MTRPRFSLRGLLLLTVAVAAVCWYRDLPRQKANRFARLIEAGDYDAAESLCMQESLDRFNDLIIYGNIAGCLPRAEVTVSPRSWLAGWAQIEIHLDDGGDVLWWTAFATAGGIEFERLEDVFAE